MDPEIYPQHDHGIRREQLDPDALKIIERLTRYGFKGRLVGGGVRDILLGKNPKDYDIATDATPRDIKRLFRNSRIIGRRFKLAHIYFSERKIIEVATFRDNSTELDEVQQIASDNVFGTEETDAVRRDLTINALFFDPVNESIIDYVGGMRDLREGVVRVIGDPDIRFLEDPVRLLRVVRHAARSTFVIEDECYKSLVKNRGFLENASQVRLYEELKKDVSSGHILPILQLLGRTRLLEILVPEFVKYDLLEVAPFVESLSRFDELTLANTPLSPTVFFSLVALFCKDPDYRHDITEIFESKEAIEEHVDGLFSSLQVPRRERERVVHVLYTWVTAAEHTDKTPLRVKSFQIPSISDVIDMIKILPLRDGDRRVLSLLHSARKENEGRPSGRDHPQKRNFRKRHRPKTTKDTL